MGTAATNRTPAPPVALFLLEEPSSMGNGGGNTEDERGGHEIGFLLLLLEDAAGVRHGSVSGEVERSTAWCSRPRRWSWSCRRPPCSPFSLSYALFGVMRAAAVGCASSGPRATTSLSSFRGSRSPQGHNRVSRGPKDAAHLMVFLRSTWRSANEAHGRPIESTT